MKTKVCTKCGEEKEVSEFDKSTRNKSGLYGSCKKCRKQWRIQNKEKIKESNKIYNQNNKEKRKEYRRKYYQENKERVLKKNKEYFERNPDVRNRIQRKYAKKQIEELSDWYVKQVIASSGKILFKDIPQSMIDERRKQIKEHRKLKPIKAQIKKQKQKLKKQKISIEKDRINRGVKFCRSCGQEKKLIEFHNNKGKKVSQCKKCCIKRTHKKILKDIKNVSNWYAKCQISNELDIPWKDIPSYMVEAKKIRIKAHRLYNKNKTHNKND